jgi:glycosyltransferase involved in cell wall biosynthesis
LDRDDRYKQLHRGADTMTTTQLVPLQAPPRSGRRPLNVAIVDEELPYPPTSGKRIRTLNLTLRLAARHRLTYLCHRNASPDEARRAADFFAANGIETVVVDRAVPRKSGAVFYARLAANLFSPLPYSVASHTSPGLRAALVRHAATRPADLWHCEWTPYAESLRVVTGRRVVVAHNVESVIWRRYYETEKGMLRRWYVGRQWRKFDQFERRALAGADRTIAVSDVDARRFNSDFGLARVDVVENGVDTAYFHPETVRRTPGRLLFLGSLDWRPNLDGISRFLDDVFPAVRAAEPDATLDVVGRNPPTWLRRRVAETPGAALHADVPDVRPFLARCALMVVPLRIGGGSRLKILEALASGVAVVSTNIGAEGLCLEPGRDISVTEDIEKLAPALVAALRSPQAMARQAASGRKQVLERYDWRTLADEMERIWLSCVEDCPIEEDKAA